MRTYSGFTLVELIVSIIVLGIIVAAGAPVLYNSITAYNSSLNTVQTLDKLRYATYRMAREFREMSYCSSSCSVTGFQFTSGTMSTTQPSFTKVDYMVSSTGAVTSNTYTVAIAASGSNVNITYTNQSNNATTTAVLTDQLSSTANSLQFAYFDQAGCDQAGVWTLSTSTVRYVEIRLILSANGQDYAERTCVALRNI